MEVILGRTSGFCGGVRNAIVKTKEEAEKSNDIIYCLGDLVHNPIVLNDLKRMGVQVIEKLEGIPNPKGKLVIIRAHGVKKEIYEEAKQLEIKIKDLTCPKVLAIHEFVDKYSGENSFIFLIGEKKHPEVIGTASFCGNNSVVIENEEELQDAIDIFNNKSKENKNMNLIVVAQTTFNLEKFEEFEKIIKDKIDKNIEVIVNNTICNATRIRQEETEKIAKEVDGMVIIGGRKSTNTNKLYQISLENCKNVVMVENAQELKENLDNFKMCKKIGIMAGASTPEESIEEIVNIVKNM